MTVPGEIEQDWEGCAERECGAHRITRSGRAWCFDCADWCDEDVPCRGCELPRIRGLLRAIVDTNRKTLTAYANWREHGGTKDAEAMDEWDALMRAASVIAGEHELSARDVDR